MKIVISACVLIVALALGSCATPGGIDEMIVSVDVTGVWAGTTSTVGGSEIRLELKQRGAKVSGTLRKVGAGTAGPWATIGSGPVDGSVANDVFTFRCGAMTGEMTVIGDEMKGDVTTSGTSPMTLRRIDSSPPSSSR